MGLRGAALSIRENYAQAMAVTAPLGSVVSTTTAAIAYSGGNIVFASILAFLAGALWIYSLSLYSSRFASAGGYYTFVYAAYRSKFLAFSEAVVEFFSFVFLNAVNVLAIYLMVRELLAFYGFKMDWWLSIAVLTASLLYPTIASYAMDVKRLLSTVVIFVATLEVLALLGLFALSLEKGFNLRLFTPSGDVSLGGLAIAFLMVLVTLDGAGTATYLGEETGRPHDNVTKGMWLAFIVGGVSTILGTYALVALWPGNLLGLSESAQPLIAITAGYGILPVILIILVATKSLLISNIGTTLAAARILYNLSREDAAPRIFQSVNSKGQPYVATLLVGLLTSTLLFLFTLAAGFTGAFIALGAVTGILWIVGRVLDSAGAPLMLYRLGELEPTVKALFLKVAAPIAITAVNMAGLILSSLDLTFRETLTLAGITLAGLAWYMLIARYGSPGTLVVDRDNIVVGIDVYLSRYNAHSRAAGQPGS